MLLCRLRMRIAFEMAVKALCADAFKTGNFRNAAKEVIAANQGATKRSLEAFGGVFKMKQYLLSSHERPEEQFHGPIDHVFIIALVFTLWVRCFLPSEFIIVLKELIRPLNLLLVSAI